MDASAHNSSDPHHVVYDLISTVRIFVGAGSQVLIPLITLNV